mmetsp:Transcript_5667/g.8973  ORF Transcript_5667/g.8973 Transcript_5667/m.8973 type:complete len:175 (-) Transcript_5667:7-531(-)
MGVLNVKKEYHEKVECGYEFSPGDLEATPRKLVIMLLVSFFGAFCSAFCGIGPGNIFCPVLVMIGIQAQVATATGMYITMFTTLSATIQVIIFKKIYLVYAAYILLMTALSTVPGIFFQGYLVRTTGHVSYQVLVLATIMYIAMFSVAGFTIPDAIHRADEGEELFEFYKYCDV